MVTGVKVIMLFLESKTAQSMYRVEIGETEGV